MPLDDGRVIDRGEAIHDMSIRLVVDSDLNVIDAIASTDASPYAICRGAAASLECLKGLRIGRGWTKTTRELLAGRHGCTHLTELLGQLATVAFQTIWTVRRLQPQALDASGKPRKIDSCFAYSSDRELVRQRWPLHYSGPDGTDRPGPA
jgi:hypothetical protein